MKTGAFVIKIMLQKSVAGRKNTAVTEFGRT